MSRAARSSDNRPRFAAERKDAMDTLKIEIKKVLALAAALERDPAEPGEDVVADRAENRRQLQARFDALLVEACAPGYSGHQVTTDPPVFICVPEEHREALREADEAGRRLLNQW
jgi:DnaJ-domain-containing protein 1